ncbi:MAG: hypothetical protein CTY38_04835 [Methylotenera sp.]|nr:MAG: hypothetical protein CTY38_04835 [Methylotenera sp.]
MALTPSTRKLMHLREGKGTGMLSEEEIMLLRKSGREISEACRHARESGIVKAEVPAYIGILSDKTNYMATLEEIENVIPDGWAKDELNKKI